MLDADDRGVHELWAGCAPSANELADPQASRGLGLEAAEVKLGSKDQGTRSWRSRDTQSAVRLLRLCPRLAGAGSHQPPRLCGLCPAKAGPLRPPPARAPP